MLCDNKAVINLSNNLVSYDRIKIVEIDYHFQCEKINSKGLILSYMKTLKKVADIFTEVWGTDEFERNTDTFGMFEIYI